MCFEFYKTFKDKKRYIVMLLIVLIPMFDLALNIYSEYAPYLQNPECYPGGLFPSEIYSPAFASFLTSANSGHIGQMLLIWLMPIYIFLLYVDGYLQEKAYHYSTIYFSKKNRRSVYRNKIFTAFSLAAGINLVSLLLNHIFANVAFNGGTNMKSMYVGMAGEGFLDWCLANLEAGYFIYLLSYCLLVGLYAVFCMNLAFIFNDRKIVYAIGIIMWLVMIMNPYSITYAMQPFIEYGIKYFCVAWGVILGVVFISYCFVKITWERRDEI